MIEHRLEAEDANRVLRRKAPKVVLLSLLGCLRPPDRAGDRLRAKACTRRSAGRPDTMGSPFRSRIAGARRALGAPLKLLALA